MLFAHTEGVGLGEETSVSGSFIFFYIEHLTSSYFKLPIWELCHPTVGKVLFWFGSSLSQCQLPLWPAQLLSALHCRCLLESRTAWLGKAVGFVKGQQSQDICLLSLRSHPQQYTFSECLHIRKFCILALCFIFIH